MPDPNAGKPADPAETEPPAQPLVEAQEAAPPVVHPQKPAAGFVSILNSPARVWRVGTLVYTTGGLMVLFFWLLFGDFALSMRERSVGPVAQLMLRTFGTSNFTMSVLLSMVPTGISMVLSPIVSYKSDRLRSRWGRRIPFLLIPTPIAALAMIGMAFCPQIATGLQAVTGDFFSRKAALITVFSVFWTFFEFAAIISGSVLGGLFNDVVPRPVIGRFFGLFRAVSLLDGIIFNWYILGHAEEHFALIFFWIALVFGIGFSLMCFMVKEGDYPPPPPLSEDHRAGGFFAAAGLYFRECFSHAHYRWIFAAMALAAMATLPINSFSVMYAKSLNVTMDKWDPNGPGFASYRLGYGGVVALTYICSLCLAYFLGALVDRFHTLRLSIVAMAMYAVATGLGALFINDAESFGWAFFAHVLISGTYFTAAASMGQALLPRSRFSQFASAGALVQHLMTLIISPILGAVLDWSGSNYRITYIWSCVFSVAALMLLWHVYRRFMAMGGPQGYVAPLDENQPPLDPSPAGTGPG